MPYVVWKKNGKVVNMPWVLTSEEADNLERNSPNDSYILINTTTRRTRKLKGENVDKRRSSHKKKDNGFLGLGLL